MKTMSLISFICIIIDQIIKKIVSINLTLNSSVTVIDNFFYLTYVKNEGAAWSLFSGNRLFLITIAFISLFNLFLFIKGKKLKKIEIVTYGLLIGGIIGNLLDRILLGHVIDYLDFYILNYDYPIFNFADICIVLSVILIIIDLFRGEKDGIKNK